MTNEKSITIKKSQDPPVENGNGLDTMDLSERAASDHAASDDGSDQHMLKMTLQQMN